MMDYARKIGKALAYLQDTIDVFVGWCFHRLQSKVKKQEDGGPFRKTVKTTIGFFAQVGDAFYQEYDRLKNRHTK